MQDILEEIYQSLERSKIEMNAHFDNMIETKENNMIIDRFLLKIRYAEYKRKKKIEQSS